MKTPLKCFQWAVPCFTDYHKLVWPTCYYEWAKCTCITGGLITRFAIDIHLDQNCALSQSLSHYPCACACVCVRERVSVLKYVWCAIYFVRVNVSVKYTCWSKIHVSRRNSAIVHFFICTCIYIAFGKNFSVMKYISLIFKFKQNPRVK